MRLVVRIALGVAHPWDADTDKPIKCVRPLHGPVMLRLGSRPVSVNDALAGRDGRGSVLCPKDRNWSLIWSAFSAGTWELVSPQQLHNERLCKQGKGRPPILACEKATALKDAYWFAGVSQTALMRMYGLSRQSVSKICNGRDYWYA